MCNWLIMRAGRHCMLGTCVLIKIDSGAYVLSILVDMGLFLSHCLGARGIGRETFEV